MLAKDARRVAELQKKILDEEWKENHPDIENILLHDCLKKIQKSALRGEFYWKKDFLFVDNIEYRNMYNTFMSVKKILVEMGYDVSIFSVQSRDITISITWRKFG